MLRMYDLDEGDLKYDDVPIKKIRLDTAGKSVMCPRMYSLQRYDQE